MGNIEDLERAVALFCEQSDTLTTADLARPTPCNNWDVRALVGHMTGIYGSVADALHGTRVDLVAASAPIGDAPAQSVDDAAAAMMRAWREPDALDRTLATTIRDMPAALATRIVVGDSLLHAWDLGHALDRDVEMPEDLAAAQFEMMQQYYDPAARGPDAGFDVAVSCADDASVQDRLVALSGRDPAWIPAR